MALSYTNLFLLFLRSIQTLLSLTVLILYATALSRAPQKPSSYVYAILCSTTTLLTLCIYCVPNVPVSKFFVWDFILAVLWAALSGVFGMIYLEKGGEARTEWVESSNKETGMKVAVVFDLVGMVCWMMTAGWGCIGYYKNALEVRRVRKEQKQTDKMLEGQERGRVDMCQDSIGDCERGLLGSKLQEKCTKA